MARQGRARADQVAAAQVIRKRLQVRVGQDAVADLPATWQVTLAQAREGAPAKRGGRGVSKAAPAKPRDKSRST